MVLSKSCRAKRVRLARIGWSAFALTAMALPVKLAAPAEAKTPGSTYCYHGTCHRVKTIAETQALVGVEETITASHYDDCSRDRYNPCGLTSSGERFHPDRPDNTASPIYPDGTTLLVWSPETERALVVRVNNAGPYWGNRTLDLSRAAAEKLGFAGKGVAKLRVRVVKAPEPEETVYSRNRSYPPVPGDIGTYDSLAQAETGMVVAMALQASAASPMAPVTTANAFARSDEDAEPLVAEAPQMFGRRHIQVAAYAPPEPRNNFTLGIFNPNQSHPGQLASLSEERFSNQSRWNEELDDVIGSSIETGSVMPPKLDVDTSPKIAELSSVELQDNKPDASTNEVKVATADPAVLPESRADTKRAVKAATVTEPKSKPAAKRAARRKDDDDDEVRSSRSRRSQARPERRAHSQGRRIARNAGRRYRDRYAYADERPMRVAPERSAGQLMSLGIRAQSSSAM